MRNQQNGQAEATVDIFQQFKDRAGGGRIERAGGFVAQQYFGIAGQGAGDGDALFLAAGKIGGPGVLLIGQADQLQQFRYALFNRFARQTAQLKRQRHVAEDGTRVH